jgi:hypothetical protein
MLCASINNKISNKFCWQYCSYKATEPSVLGHIVENLARYTQVTNLKTQYNPPDEISHLSLTADIPYTDTLLRDIHRVVYACSPQIHTLPGRKRPETQLSHLYRSLSLDTYSHHKTDLTSRGDLANTNSSIDLASPSVSYSPTLSHRLQSQATRCESSPVANVEVLFGEISKIATPDGTIK